MEVCPSIEFPVTFSVCSCFTAVLYSWQLRRFLRNCRFGERSMLATEKHDSRRHCSVLSVPFFVPCFVSSLLSILNIQRLVTFWQHFPSSRFRLHIYLQFKAYTCFKPCVPKIRGCLLFPFPPEECGPFISLRRTLRTSAGSLKPSSFCLKEINSFRCTVTASAEFPGRAHSVSPWTEDIETVPLLVYFSAL